MTQPEATILIVEDMPQIRTMLEVTLRFEGFTVQTASNGQEALDLIAAAHPTLVITDILMPRMDGFALVYQLRKDAATRQIPVIFLSATYVTKEDKEFALSLGATRFLEKPVDTTEFLQTIRQVLTHGPGTSALPLGEREFYLGYRKRLENKLRQKNQQIIRTERLLSTLPKDQIASFQSLLAQTIEHRDEILTELQEILMILKTFKED
jgi:CheY-like chemotaxis protein